MHGVAPISLCMIVKNEIKQIEACLKSIRPYVKEIVIVDTGSTDGTQEIAKKYADIFEQYNGCNDENGNIVNFANARQHSFNLATNDWVMWIDGDDEVQNAELLYDIVNNYKSGTPAYVMFPYEYARDEKGNVICLHSRERLFYMKNCFKWVGVVHEVVEPIANPNVIKDDRIRIIHKRVESGKIIENNRNLRILKKWYEENGDSNPRELYYLGLEYGYVGDVDNSLKFHKKYIEKSTWDEEKFMSCMKVSELYSNIGNHDASIEWALKSLTIREGWAESYFSLARSYYYKAQSGGAEELRNWQRCIHFSELGIKTPPTQTVLFINPLERSYDVHRYLNIAYNKVGRTKDALESVKSGLLVKPDDENLKCNARVYEEHISKDQLKANLDSLLSLGKERSWIASFVTTYLNESTNDVIIRPNNNIRFITENPKDIVFYVGPSVEKWNPDSINDKGIGGSETLVWEMSYRLSKMGHKIRVYGDCSGIEGVFNGVQFLNYDKFEQIECDVLISSRRPNVFDESFKNKSKVNICWIHDIHCGELLTHARSVKIDAFFTLSDWHKNFFMNTYKFIHEKQVFVTRNGIDLSRFVPNVKNEFNRNRHKAVYSSSPDRGLQSALMAWPTVRNFVPDAQLHIYYGFENWKACANQDQLKIINHLQTMIENTNGVFYHGRIGQKTLAKEFMSSGVWAYPTWFSETSCVTAMEALASGLRVVTSPIAALNETVGNNGVMVKGDWLSPNYIKSWSDEIVKAMTDDESHDLNVRQTNIDRAFKEFGMDELAKNWNELIHKICEDVKENVVVPYKSAI